MPRQKQYARKSTQGKAPPRHQPRVSTIDPERGSTRPVNSRPQGGGRVSTVASASIGTLARESHHRAVGNGFAAVLQTKPGDQQKQSRIAGASQADPPQDAMIHQAKRQKVSAGSNKNGGRLTADPSLQDIQSLGNTKPAAASLTLASNNKSDVLNGRQSIGVDVTRLSSALEVLRPTQNSCLSCTAPLMCRDISGLDESNAHKIQRQRQLELARVPPSEFYAVASAILKMEISIVEKLHRFVVTNRNVREAPEGVSFDKYLAFKDMYSRWQSREDGLKKLLSNISIEATKVNAKTTFFDLPFLCILGFLLPQDRWNLSAVCKGALQAVEIYSEHVFRVILGPNDCNVDSTFQTRVRASPDSRQELSFRYLVQKSLKIPLHELDFFRWEHICVSPSQEVFISYKEKIQVYDSCTKAVLASLEWTDLFKRLPKHIAQPSKGRIRFLDDDHIAILTYGYSYLFVWEFARGNNEEGITYLDGSEHEIFVSRDFLSIGRGEFLFTLSDRDNYLHLKTLNLKNKSVSTLCSTLRDCESSYVGELLDFVHGRFVVVFISWDFDRRVVVFDLSIGKLSDDLKLSDWCTLEPIEHIAGSFCSWDLDGKVTLWTLDPQKGVLSCQFQLQKGGVHYLSIAHNQFVVWYYQRGKSTSLHVSVFDLSTGKLLEQEHNDVHRYREMRDSPGSVCCLAYDGKVTLWTPNPPTGTFSRLYLFTAGSRNIQDVCFHSVSKTHVVLSENIGDSYIHETFDLRSMSVDRTFQDTRVQGSELTNRNEYFAEEGTLLSSEPVL